jgi:hypothetical protein
VYPVIVAAPPPETVPAPGAVQLKGYDVPPVQPFVGVPGVPGDVAGDEDVVIIVLEDCTVPDVPAEFEAVANALNILTGDIASLDVMV